MRVRHFPADLLYGWERIGTECRGNQYGRTRFADNIFLRPECLLPNDADRIPAESKRGIEDFEQSGVFRGPPADDLIRGEMADRVALRTFRQQFDRSPADVHVSEIDGRKRGIEHDVPRITTIAHDCDVVRNPLSYGGQ